jgi:hypothetical protein
MTTQDIVVEYLNQYDHERSLIQQLAEAERKSASLADDWKGGTFSRMYRGS